MESDGRERESERNTLIDKISGRAYKHVVDNFALTASAAPVFAAIETTAGEMSWKESLISRGASFLLGLAGVAFVYASGSDVFRSIAKVNDRSSEKIQLLADTLYGGLFNFAFQYGLYVVTTHKPVGELLWPSVYAGLTGAVVGIPNRAFLSIFRDLAGIEICERGWYPECVRKMDAKQKRSLLGGISAFCAAATTGAYFCTS